MKSGSLTLLEPLGPVQTCNGIALSLPLYVIALRNKENHSVAVGGKIELSLCTP